jgi:hypothetical protein
LDQAIATLEQLPKNSLPIVEADPFRPRITYQDKDGGLWKNKTYDKLSFAKTLRALIAQTKLQDGKNHLRHLILGNAYFNTLSGRRAGSMKGSPAQSGWHYGYEVVFLKEYEIDGHKGRLWPRSLDAQPAINYYNLSISETDDPEFQALAYYMIARCERFKNEWITRSEEENARISLQSKRHQKNYWDEYHKALKKNSHLETQIPSFAILHDQYAHTAVVDMLMRECPDFAAYCTK